MPQNKNSRIPYKDRLQAVLDYLCKVIHFLDFAHKLFAYHILDRSSSPEQ